MIKKSKKIAIISSSPLMMMLALCLIKKGNDVNVYEFSKTKAGAWAWFQDYFEKYNLYISKYSNAIVPLNKKEENFIAKMNKSLVKNYKIKVSKTNKKIITNYSFKKKFIYNFSNFYKFALKKIKIKKIFIFKIESTINKKIKLNNEFLYDEVYLPSYTGVKTIKVPQRKPFNPPYTQITSEHISIIANKFKLKKFYYSDFFNESFDRVKIDKVKNFYTLTARLSHKMKGTKISTIKKRYLSNFVEKKDIINVKLSKFRNFYRNKKQLIMLKKALSKTNIKYVDTTQFVCGFYFLIKILTNNKIN